MLPHSICILARYIHVRKLNTLTVVWTFAFDSVCGCQGKMHNRCSTVTRNYIALICSLHVASCVTILPTDESNHTSNMATVLKGQ